MGHTDKAYNGIRNMLFHNEIIPGQKLGIQDLAERLGMSQTPVIQALKWLEFQNLVHHVPNRGYFMAPINLQEVEEIYELRELIELALLPRTIERLDESGTQTLKTALQDHLDAAKTVYLYDRLSKDMEFHLTLARLSGALVQARMLSNLFDLLYLKYGGNVLFITSMDSADKDHQELFEAILGGDLNRAEATLAGHILRVKNHVLESLEMMQQAKQQPPERPLG